jgi:hypothetical protein
MRLLLLFLATAAAFAQPPGRAEASVTGSTAEVHNAMLSAKWDVGKRGLRLVSVEDRLSGQVLPLDEDAFVLVMKDGRRMNSSQMIAKKARVSALKANPNAARLAEHFSGRVITAQLDDSTQHLRVKWSAELRDGSNYLRQEVTIRARHRDAPIVEVRLVSGPAATMKVIGSVKGSPIVIGNAFVAFEHPLSNCSQTGDQISCSVSRELPLRKDGQTTYSSVIGVTRPGQLRREFLSYIERERAHPYRTFLHYNTWYDLGYFGRFDEAGVLDRIHAFGEELTRKRGVKLDSFLFDDGWDDPSHLWHFNSGFPNGFTEARSGAAQYGAAPGVWLSPWGGYGEPKKQRLESARKLGLETYQGGLALSGRRYFDYFRRVCLEMMDRYGVNQFKFDGTGNANRVMPDSAFDSDFAAAIYLISELRARKPDLYVNLTTGTYPSPFWLRYADSIWRGGEDHDFAGVGTARQRWITYRDGDTYEHVVKAGPLFPLNSLMLHGLIYAQHAKDLDSDPSHDFADEVHSYFGTGTQLQEMYITPSLLSPADWDTLASAAKWSRENADVVRDTHWIGGDPLNLEIYGWAAWMPRKGIITLRNPSDHEQSFDLDVSKAFELPSGDTSRFRVSSVWIPSASMKEVVSGQPYTVRLKPFEVLTLEAEPAR